MKVRYHRNLTTFEMSVKTCNAAFAATSDVDHVGEMMRIAEQAYFLVSSKKLDHLEGCKDVDAMRMMIS